MDTRNFCFFTWTHREVATGFPVNDSLSVLDFAPMKFRELRYTIPKKGFGGQSCETMRKGNATRNQKILAAMQEWFLKNILPRIADKLNPAAWLDLSQSLHKPELATAHGFTLYRADDGRQAWIHASETDKIQRASEMGALPVTA